MYFSFFFILDFLKFKHVDGASDGKKLRIFYKQDVEVNDIHTNKKLDHNNKLIDFFFYTGTVFTGFCRLSIYGCLVVF